MLTPEIREAAKKAKLLTLFKEEIVNLRLDEIHKLYDFTHITTSRLVEQLHKRYAPLTDFTKAVYVDIAYILVEEIINSPEVEAFFLSLYDKVYPNVLKTIHKIEDRIHDGYDAAFSAYQKAIQDFIPSLDIRHINKTDFSLFVYYTYRSDKIWYSGILVPSMISEDAKAWFDREENCIGYKIFEDKYVYSDTEEPIFSSKMFEKYIKKQRTRVADYLGIEESKLNKYIQREMKFDVRKEDQSYLVESGIPGHVNMATIHAIQDNHGSASWIQTITSSRDIRQGSLGYTPDIDKIIRGYYYSKVQTVYVTKMNDGEPFLKSSLAYECVSENPVEDYQGFCFLYNIDIVYKMYQAMQEKYYADFSWEQVTHKNVLTRDNLVIQDLRRIIQEKERIIESQNRDIESLTAGIRKQDEKEVLPYLQVEQRLNRIIDKKDEEINELKEYIRSQNDLIQLLNEPEEFAEETTKIDVDVLKTKRYLFVGYADEAIPELKKLFPDSIFMKSDNTVLSNIQVDGIVYLIRFMSHGMLYRVQAQARLNEIPSVFCKGRRLRNVLASLVELIAVIEG